jgi:hypothetical protein
MDGKRGLLLWQNMNHKCLKNRMLRKISEGKKDEVSEKFSISEFHIKDLSDLFRSPNFVD